jgi:hypothetical protein
MPAPESPEPPEPFDRLLDRWGHETPPAPGSLAAEVWRRIERAEHPAGWRERLHAAFARPSFATAFVAACVLLGLFLAEARTSRLQAEQGAQLAQSYARLIDPLLREETPAPPAKP